MEFKFLKKNTQNNLLIDKSNKLHTTKYNKILNNLLGITSRFDSAIYTRIGSQNLDVNKFIDSSQITKIMSKTNFKISVNKKSLEKTLILLENAKSAKEVLKLASDLNIKATKVLENSLASSFEETKEKMKEKMILQHSSFLANWKKYKKSINDAFSQTNIWPLFIGTYFIKGKLGDKVINGPLLLKKIDIEIIGNDVFLISKDETISINDKLSFVIEQELGINLPILNEENDKIEMFEIIKELDLFLKNTIDITYFEFNDLFQELNKQDISNTKLAKAPGIVMLQCQPSGGALRKATLDLISSGEIQNILHFDGELVNFQRKSIEKIINEEKAIARVCPTDASQEKAILAALDQHAIIIGPPGTGKSQTIANLLTNILLQNKKALFISQKKVALEVVVERMGSLQYFMLQLLENSNQYGNEDKKSFYKNLSKFFELAKDGDQINQNNQFKNLINKDIKNYWLIKEKHSHYSQEQFDLFCQIKAQLLTTSVNSEFFVKSFFNLIHNFKKIGKFNDVENLLNWRERNIDDLALKLNVEKNKVLGFIKYYHKTFKALFALNMQLINLIDQANGNIQIFKDLLNVKDKNDLMQFFYIYSHMPSEIKPTRSFKSDEEEVLNFLIENSRNKINNIFNLKKQEDKGWLRKFMGRIERGFTTPDNFIKLFKNELKQMFNVVVSTPESLSTFVDFKNDKYDYVIFDEASQIFLEKAIPFLSIGKKIIIAGDDQQMQPSNWFSNRFDGTSADENEIEEIDSLLTFAVANSLPKYTLELNYRSSAASLTTFSSKHFYQSDLKTLDSNKKIEQPIEVIRVNGKWENNTNPDEVLKMVEILKQNIANYKKIILLTLNKAQLELVNNFLATNEPSYYEKVINGEIILKNLENIQGDEADLVIVSIGYTKESMLAATYVGRKGGRNALNVAITRAKEKMIVLSSIYSSDIKISNEDNYDLLTFKNWVSFLELTEDKQKEYSIKIEENNGSVESGFENDVYQWIIKQRLNRDVKITTQFPVGSYRIDLALIDSTTNKFLLGIEVDGFKYHSSVVQKYNDVIRQDFIEAKGYKIIRISEVLWKSDKNQILNLIQKYI